MAGLAADPSLAAGIEHELANGTVVLGMPGAATEAGPRRNTGTWPPHAISHSLNGVGSAGAYVGRVRSLPAAVHRLI